MASNFPPPGGRRPFFRSRRNDPFANIRRNQRIRAPQIRVIGPDGKQLGIMTPDKALQIAQPLGLDLVEVAAQATPPVCRIMDFGKYMYEESKKTKAKTSSSKIKEIEFSVRIEQNDFLTKLRHAEEFLDKGNKVKLRLKFRGREMAHTDIGFDVIRRAIAELSQMGTPDSEAKLTGRNIIVMVSPLPANKRKLKFHEPSPQPAHTGSDPEQNHPEEKRPEAKQPGAKAGSEA